MNRVSAVAATLTAAATLTVAAAATVTPAHAAVRLAGARPAHVRTIARTTTAAEQARLIAEQAASDPSTAIAAESGDGKYVTVVRCSGESTPPPIKLGQPGTPLTASGSGPSAGLLALLSKPNPYKTVYTCTVAVEMKSTASSTATPENTAEVAKPEDKAARRPLCESSDMGIKAKVCAKKVTLNTGFGGMAKQVAGHHPGH
jgi:hypothetical protein